jgi:hypothetical protein
MLARICLAASMIAGAQTTLARASDEIEVGTYAPVTSLSKGEVHMCDKEEVTVSVFTIPSPADKRKAVRLAGRYTYFVPMEEGESRLQSDIDPGCAFIEKSTRTMSGSSLVLAKTDSELCGAQVRTADTTIFTIAKGRITLEVRDEKGLVPGYTCVFAKKAK